MSTNSTYLAAARFAAEATPATGAQQEKRPGFFARMIERIAAARMAQARVQVGAYLASLSDERLADIGFTPDEVRAIREKGVVPVTYWQ